MSNLVQEEVRYFADFIKMMYHDDGSVSVYKRNNYDITKWFDPSKVIPGKLIGIEYQEKEGFYGHEIAWFYYNTAGDKDDIIRTYGGVITKITKRTTIVIKKSYENIVLENDIEPDVKPREY